MYHAYDEVVVSMTFPAPGDSMAGGLRARSTLNRVLGPTSGYLTA